MNTTTKLIIISFSVWLLLFSQEPSSRSFLGGLFRNRDVEQRLQQAEQEKRQYLEERDVAAQKHREALAECEEARRKAASVQDELEWSITRLEERERLHAQALRKYDGLQEEYYRKCHLLQQANKQVDQKTTKISQLVDEFKQARQESKRLQELIESRDAMVENIRLELNAERQQASRHQSSAADQQSLQGIMEYIQTTNREQIQHLKEQLSSKEKELEASHKNVLRLETRLKSFQDQGASQSVSI